MSDNKINKELSEKIENYDKSNLEKVEAKEGLPEGVKRDMTLAGEDNFCLILTSGPISFTPIPTHENLLKEVTMDHLHF